MEAIEKCQEFFKEKNLNEYREKEKNEKIRILNFNNEEDFFYFGETLSEDSPDVMEGFGFISNKKENEFILGNFKEDNFIKGIWIKNNGEVFIGEFIYNDTKDVCKKTNFKGVMLNKTEKFSNFFKRCSPSISQDIEPRSPGLPNAISKYLRTLCLNIIISTSLSE